MKVGVELLDEKYKSINMDLEEFSDYIHVLSHPDLKFQCEDYLIKVKRYRESTILEIIIYTNILDEFSRKKAIRILIVLTEEEIKQNPELMEYLINELKKLITEVLGSEYCKQLDFNRLTKCIIKATKPNKRKNFILLIVALIFGILVIYAITH